jgi:hypothetical protein
MRARLLLLTALATTPALADAPKAKPLSPAQQQAYDAALRKGRQLQGKKQWAEAIRAFQACVAIAPDDAACAGELGWTAYLAKDLVLAESATRQALAGTGSPALRGAALYNLGLIEEAKRDQPAAIAAYRESLQVRPNGVVRAALAKLAPDVAAAFDPFKPVALAGPFSSIEAYCATTPKTTPEEYTCSCGADDTKAAARTLPPGILQVESVTRGCGAAATESGQTDYGIAVKVASGWYAGVVATVHQNRFCMDTMVLAGVTASPGKAALARFAITGECAGGNGGTKWTEQALVAIGGAKPSATPLIVVTRHETDSDTPYDASKVSRTRTDIALEPAWAADGSLTLTGKTTGLDQGEASNILGEHALVFP